MKSWLLLLGIGIVAAVLYHEKIRSVAPEAEPVASAPAASPTPAPESAPPAPGEPPPAAPPAPTTDSFANLVGESQRTAVAKYPALGVPGSEMNLRFAEHYKKLAADRSPRLQNPAWPLQVADECALGSGTQPVAKVSAPPPVVALNKVSAVPLSAPVPAGTPAASLRIQPPPTGVPQTLVFHPAAGGAPLATTSPAPVAAAKPSGVLPFVTLDAVNQSSGNHFVYNYNSYYWYDISFRQSVGIDINVRNMSRESAAVNLRWLFFARRNGNGGRFVFGAAGKELDLAPGQKADIPAASPTVQSREVSDYWYNGTRFLSGSKYEGWLVQLVDRASNRVIKQTGSTSYLEDLAKRTDFSALVEDFKNGRSQGTEVF